MVLLFALAAGGLFAFGLALRRLWRGEASLRRLAAGVCDCGYDLRGLREGGVCPECGAPTAVAGRGARADVPRRPGRRGAVVWAVEGAGVASCVVGAVGAWIWNGGIGALAAGAACVFPGLLAGPLAAVLVGGWRTPRELWGLIAGGVLPAAAATAVLIRVIGPAPHVELSTVAASAMVFGAPFAGYGLALAAGACGILRPGER